MSLTADNPNQKMREAESEHRKDWRAPGYVH